MNYRILPGVAAGLLLLASSASYVYTQTPETPATRDSANNSRPVEAELKRLTDESNKTTPPEILAAGRKGNEELVASGILKQALNVGDTIPAFELSDARGKAVKSSELLAKGPMVITFYRGAWCPFCNLYLHTLQKYLPQFQSHGASLVAISGETPDNTLTVEQKNGLKFIVLSDPNFAVAREFKIVYEMPKVVNDVILGVGFDIKDYYKTEKAELPLSATYVVDRDGKIVYAFLDPDYHHRAEPADLISALAKLK